jgi:hypothetical protein
MLVTVISLKLMGPGMPLGPVESQRETKYRKKQGYNYGREGSQVLHNRNHRDHKAATAIVGRNIGGAVYCFHVQNSEVGHIGGAVLDTLLQTLHHALHHAEHACVHALVKVIMTRVVPISKVLVKAKCLINTLTLM